MKRIRIRITPAGIALAVALSLAEPAGAKQFTSNDINMNEPPQEQDQSGLTDSERSFLQSVAAINATEIELGRIATKKATNPDIKKIGENLVREHTAANQQLQRLAGSKGVRITSEPASSQRKAIESLSQVSGERFNKEFLRQARLSQQRALTLFERTSRRAQDPDIRNWASKMLPAVQARLAILTTRQPEAVADKAPASAQPSPQASRTPKHQHSPPAQGHFEGP